MSEKQYAYFEGNKVGWICEKCNRIINLKDDTCVACNRRLPSIDDVQILLTEDEVNEL